MTLLKTAAQMRQSKILIVSAPAGSRRETIKKKFGCEVIDISTEQVVEAHKNVDEQLATEVAETLFLKPATKIVEPTREEIIKSTKMYLGMRQMLAITRPRPLPSTAWVGCPSRCWAIRASALPSCATWALPGPAKRIWTAP